MENEEKSQKDQKTKEQSIWKEIWDYAKIILIVFVIAYLLGHFVYINARIPSGSMEQTIMTGDRVFGNRHTEEDFCENRSTEMNVGK